MRWSHYQGRKNSVYDNLIGFILLLIHRLKKGWSIETGIKKYVVKKYNLIYEEKKQI